MQFENFMIGTFRNGEVSIYDASGAQIFNRQPMGEHTSNTAVQLMMHPVANKPMLLCGQTLGYITAYDLPEFRPRGSFCCKDRSDVKAIVDAQSEGLFLTAGLHGDIIIWRWTQGGQASVSPFAPSPFGAPGGMPGAPAASNPFGPPGGGAPGGMMM